MTAYTLHRRGSVQISRVEIWEIEIGRDWRTVEELIRKKKQKTKRKEHKRERDEAKVA